MRSGFASAIALAAILTATNVQAASVAEPAPKVSVQSEEGQAIIKRVREITGRLRFMSLPVVYPTTQVYYTAPDPDRTLGGPAPARVRPEAMQISTGLRGKLTAERAALLNKLDVDPSQHALLLYR